MALSLILGEAKLTAEHMETTAEVTLDKVNDGYAITSVHLTLKAKVPGADQQIDWRDEMCPASSLGKPRNEAKKH